MRALARLHAEKGTQEAAGKAIGVGQEQFGRYLNGNGEPSLPTLLLLADALGMGLDELLGRKATPAPTLAIKLTDEDVKRIADEVAARRQSSVPPSSRKRPSVRPMPAATVPLLPPKKP